MAKKRIITNEELCSALLTHGTIREAAGVLNVSERTLYNMMSDSDFKQMYEYAQADILSSSVLVCQSKLTEAIECISDIMNDKGINPQTRLQAAQSIIKNAISMYEVMERLKIKAEQETKSPFDDLF